MSSLSLHLNVGGHLGCFYVLTIVNGVAMNIIGVHISFLNYSFCLGICPGEGLVNQMEILGNLHLFSIVTEPTYISTPTVLSTPGEYC